MPPSESQPPEPSLKNAALEKSGLKNARRAWQLPRGVSAGTWDYVVEPTIATQYDAYHGQHPLMRLDTEWVERLINEMLASTNPASANSLVLADFGCGTARIARHMRKSQNLLHTPHSRPASQIRTLNIDLSRPMLETAARGLRTESHLASNTVACNTAADVLIESNLVDLDWLCDCSIDLAVCLFSSLGMIRGREHRRSFLGHVRRSLKPGGRFLVHVHNRGHSWIDPRGPSWLLSTRLKSWLGRHWEMGDRVYVYRGLPQMFLHIYSRRELKQDLQAAGFTDIAITPLNLTGSAVLQSRWLEYFRAGGHFAVCHR